MNGSEEGWRVGLFGGTFDPPHLGHLRLALEARRQLSLHRVVWIVTGQSPFKRERQPSAPDARREMIQATIKGQRPFVFSDIELNRPAPQYTADTVDLLAEQYPKAIFVLLMGSDVLEEFPRWQRPSSILALCRLGVFRRAGAGPQLATLDHDLPGLSERVDWIQAPPLEITASDIRRRVSEGQPYGDLVPEAVEQIIEERGLYRPAP